MRSSASSAVSAILFSVGDDAPSDKSWFAKNVKPEAFWQKCYRFARKHRWVHDEASDFAQEATVHVYVDGYRSTFLQLYLYWKRSRTGAEGSAKRQFMVSKRAGLLDEVASEARETERLRERMTEGVFTLEEKMWIALLLAGFEEKEIRTTFYQKRAELFRHRFLSMMERLMEMQVKKGVAIEAVLQKGSRGRVRARHVGKRVESLKRTRRKAEERRAKERAMQERLRERGWEVGDLFRASEASLKGLVECTPRGEKLE